MVSFPTAAVAAFCLLLAFFPDQVHPFQPISAPLTTTGALQRSGVSTTADSTARPNNIEFPLTVLFGKKAARKGGGGKGGGGKPRGQQQQQEKKSVQDQRFDAATRQFMFTMVGLTKMLPDKSKNILKNINLSFYPGAKIGVGEWIWIDCY